MLLDRLKKLRAKKRLTQEKVAERVGITRPAYSAYESGKRQPDYQILGKLAALFDVSTDYLLGNTDHPHHVDLANSENETIMTFEGKPIPPQDLELIRRLLRGGNHDD